MAVWVGANLSALSFNTWQYISYKLTIYFTVGQSHRGKQTPPKKYNICLWSVVEKKLVKKKWSKEGDWEWEGLIFKSKGLSKLTSVFYHFLKIFLQFSVCVSVPSWTDLIVGAPNFFDRKAEIGGAVYVYLNPFGHWDDQARPIRLNGTYDSMFGMTVSNIGDLDQDGYGGESNTEPWP